MERMLDWHYTTEWHFAQIVKSEMLLPFDDQCSERERPAVWFSANQIAEMTVSKRLPKGHLTFDKLAVEPGFRIIRIGVDRRRVHLYAFRSWERRAHIVKGAANALIREGIKAGANPADWYFTFEPVPWSKFEAIEDLTQTDDGFWLYAPFADRGRHLADMGSRPSG